MSACMRMYYMYTYRHRYSCKNKPTYTLGDIHRHTRLNAVVHVAGTEAESDVGEAEQPNLLGFSKAPGFRPTWSVPVASSLG